MDIIFPENPARDGMIIDTHAHLDDERFDDNRNELFEALPQMGVGAVINCAVDTVSAKKILTLTEQYDFCYAAVGFHPENIPDSEPDVSEISKLCEQEKVVAVGEIGLDYYWDKSRIELQKRWFIAQCELANRLSLPVIVHDRDAHADTLEILKQLKPRGVMHCFSGSVETANEIIKLGMYIGIGGVATFKNAKNLKKVIEEIPLNRILLETDAPYMAPEPYRGKTNHSGLIIRVAEKIAEIKNVTTEEVLKTTKNNAKELFEF